MPSSVLRSKRAVLVNVEIMRAFVRLRQMLAAHADLARKLAALEKRYDAQFKVVFEAIRERPRRRKRSGRSGSLLGRRRSRILVQGLWAVQIEAGRPLEGSARGGGGGRMPWGFAGGSRARRRQRSPLSAKLMMRVPATMKWSST